MCVIAGYIGPEPAAPILLEMLRREEGLAAGYYTGIATLHEGRLHYHKVVGDVEELITSTPALQLPGTIGIAHGRTPSGGDVEWGHPFVDRTGQLAYIANGALGQYKPRLDFTAPVDRLLAAGHEMRSLTQGPVESYPPLADGRSVHFSDVKCQSIAEALEAIAWYADRPDALLQASMEAYQALPGELVGLCLHALYPDRIVAVRHNKPLEIGRGSDGAVYLASTSIAFPRGVALQLRMPPLAGAMFLRDGSMEIRPFTSKDLIPVGGWPAPADLDRKIVGLLREKGPQKMQDLFTSALELWPGDVLAQKENAVFETLAPLLAAGKVGFENRPVPGMFGKGKAPQTWAYWKEALTPAQLSRPRRQGTGEVALLSLGKEDGEAVTQLVRQVWTMGGDHLRETVYGREIGAPWQEKIAASVAAYLASDGVEALKASVEGCFAGFLAFRADRESRIGEIGYNAVNPDFTGRGIGSALLEEALRRLEALGMEHVEVVTGLDDGHAPARAMYERAGFRPLQSSVRYTLALGDA